MKLFSVIFTIALFVFLTYLFRYEIYPFITYIHGNVDIKDEFKSEIRPNAMLYITLHNSYGIIFAVKEVINPVFPLEFKITRKNILYPHIVTPRCKIKAFLTYDGDINDIKSGDIYSKPYELYLINMSVRIKLDTKK
ncbi:MAG: hypothetical protein ACP5IO_03660 [Elusimicrobiales bacterium]